MMNRRNQNSESSSSSINDGDASSGTTFFLLHWRGFLLVIIPIILLPILFVETTEVKAYRCLYILLLMSLYWLTEALPLPVTGMLPIVYFPLTGIMSSEEVCLTYFSDTMVWFLGGIIVSLAVEYCNLHKRISLKTIQIVGCNPRRLHLTIILISMFFSLWISNAVVIAMMCPIIRAILKHLVQLQGVWNFPKLDEAGGYDSSTLSKLAISFYIGIAYAATIGGSGTLIAAATNAAMKGIYDGRFPEAEETIEFIHFMLYAIPPLIIITLLMCLYLQCLYLGLFRPNSADAQDIDYSEDMIRVAERRINRKHFQMGPLSCHEICVLIIFILMLVLYFTINYWDQFFEKKVNYSAPTILIIIILFVLPINYVFCKYLTGKNDEPTNSLHSWKLLQQKVPWGLIFFIGGGFALAKGVELSQLSILIRKDFFYYYGIHPALVMCLIIIFAECITQLCLNVAVVSILLPIIIELCIAMELHPLYLVLPTGLACSMAFMLPGATAPNAIVAMFANIKTGDMAIAGIGPTIISIIVLCIFCPLWGPLVYPIINNGLPDWLYK